MKAANSYRIEDTLVVCTIETRSAIVPFATLLAAVHVEPDEFADPFEKGTVLAHSLTAPPDGARPDHARAKVWTRRDGFRFVELEESECGLFDFYRAHGAARQVAALYKDGCDLDCWNVSLEIDGYPAEVKGVWGLNYAQSEAAQEVALELAS